MIAIKRHMLRCIKKFMSRHLSRHISNMPIDDKKIKSTDKDQKCKAKAGVCDTKKPEFSSYDYFLPDRKGDVQVSIIGGSDATIYTAALLKQSRLIKRIHLVDMNDLFMSPVLDASHIDTSARLKCFKRKNLKEALKETNIIALMDERNVNMDCDLNIAAQFGAASAYVHKMAEKMVQFCSNSLVAVFARPVTATLPMVSEIYKHAKWWDPDRIIGSTALDHMRMEAITANLLDLNPAFLSVPVVGGADTSTIVPLLSRTTPASGFTNEQTELLLRSFRNADRELANSGSKGSLSDAAAAAKLILTLAGGLCGFENIVASAYVRSNVLPVCRFFTSQLQFGTGGVKKNFGLPKMSSSEILLVEQAIPVINDCIEMAAKAVHCNGDVIMKNA
ncbi:malate dehydrogenase [Megachile rotundata]|uniref:malate dehydrogenase n=1 Tax=Megachile rotundata TaxID=143995 RepID=UPI000614B3E7|nr:PREDICTED: malate dehydrogenase, mitochondrial-like [Megachile rotundata]XP_012144658.1 PREDICTED: malate dehydrogenase, mitochondrial-like [Megachile rotundata]